MRRTGLHREVAGIIVIMMVALTVVPRLASGEEKAATPPSSAFLEAQSCWQALWSDGVDRDELLGRIGRRAPDLAPDERRKLAVRIKGSFALSLDAQTPPEQCLFTVRNAGLRANILSLLEKVGSPFQSPDLAAILPRGKAIEGLNPDIIQSPQFAEFARERWDAACSRLTLDALAEAEVQQRPSGFMAVAWLGFHAMPTSETAQLVEALDKVYLKRTPILSETEIAALYGPLTSGRWDDPPCVAIRDHALDALAGHLFHLLDKGPPDEQSPLEVSDYVKLSRRFKAPTDWSAALAGHLKNPATRSSRARSLLADMVREPGDHFTALSGLVKDDPAFFVYLHSGDSLASGPWDILNQLPENSARSTEILKEFFRPERHENWSIPLLDLLVTTYYPRDVGGPTSLFETVLRPLAQGEGIPATNPVRRELLTRIQKSRFPAAWGQRWILAWDAAGGLPLKGKIPVGEGESFALVFLSEVCQAAPLDPTTSREELDKVGIAYNQLLDRVFDRLFSASPPDAPLSDELILRELGRLFQNLAGYRGRFDWTEPVAIARRFWDRVEEAFDKAARKGDTAQMAGILRLMLRICAITPDTQPVEALADHICQKIFGVSPDARFRVLEENELERQAGFFRELAPAIQSTILAIREEPGGPQIQRIIDTFLVNLYLPLMRTDRFLARVGGQDDNPWLQLIECYDSEARKAAMRQRLLDALDALPYLNSPVQVRQIVVHAYADTGTRVWSSPKSVRLSENINLPLLKELMDQQSGDLESAGAGEVLRLFIAGLKDDNQWMVSCTYDASGQRRGATLFDRASLLPFLANLLTFYEVFPGEAPFLREGGEVFDPTAEGSYRYTPEGGPEFTLPRVSGWTRENVSGELRLGLLTAVAGLGATNDLKFRLAVSDVAMMLPNRPSHTAKADRKRLPEYSAVKRDILQDLQGQLAKPLSNPDRFQVLVRLMRLRYSFNQAPEPPSPEFLEAVKILESHENGGALARALMYEDYFLRLTNAQDNVKTAALSFRVKNLLELLARECESKPVSDDFGLMVQLAHRAGHADAFLSRIGPADIVAFKYMLDMLGSADSRDALDKETSCEVLWAFALALPYYGLTRESLLPADAGAATVEKSAPAAGAAAQRVDALILFCQLTAEAKRRLANWSEEESTGQDFELTSARKRLLQQLLIEHNNMVLLLAGTVFENRDLLLQTQRPRSYTAETVDFNILYRWSTSFELDGRELLAGAMGGCELNFRLARHQTDTTDDAIFRFLFTGTEWREGPITPSTPSVDAVLRVCARVATDPRYDADVDPEVREAAHKFQAGARNFIQSPPPLPWFKDPARATLRSPLTYLRVCEMAGERIVATDGWPSWELPGEAKDSARIVRWRQEAQEAHARLWQSALLGAQGEPPWQEAFIRLFCGQPATASEVRVAKPSEPHADLAQPSGAPDPLAAQRALLETIIDGEVGNKADPKDEMRLRGARATLRLLDGQERIASDSPALAYLKAYWQCLKGLVHLAQLGRGLAEDTKVPFLAQQFLKAPGGAVRPLSEDEVLQLVEEKDSGLFEALDWPNRWDDKYQDERRLQDLLGDSMANVFASTREGYGLGGGNVVPLRDKPRSYREAAWQSMTAYAAERLGGPMKGLDKASKAIESEALPPPSGQTGAEPLEVLRNLESVVSFRVTHNARVKTLRGLSNASALDEAARDRRRLYWAWFELDKATIAWAKSLETKDAWSFLAPIWAPYELYAPHGRNCFEPAALGITSVEWEKPEAPPRLREYTLLHLLGLAELCRVEGGPIQLSRSVVRDYDGVLAGASKGLAIQADPGTCAKGIRRWTGLETWLPLLEDRRLRDVVALSHCDYHYYAVPSEELAKLPRTELTAAALDLCHWSKDSPYPFAEHYERKMRFIMAQKGRALPDVGSSEWAPALSALVSLACRAEPCASPYQPEVSSDGRILLVRPRSGWGPEAIRQADDATREAQRKALRSWCLLQRVVCEDGRVETLKAGFMGYVDLLGE